MTDLQNSLRDGGHKSAAADVRCQAARARAARMNRSPMARASAVKARQAVVCSGKSRRERWLRSKEARLTVRYLMELEMLLNVVFKLVPKPYSIAVAPV